MTKSPLSNRDESQHEELLGEYRKQEAEDANDLEDNANKASFIGFGWVHAFIAFCFFFCFFLNIC